ncbi:motility associated factor glycosyltransferase family protein [Chungangia koreensis]|uniref:Motility associated factor glycosyltransferase family protein n=1 Tax=Chungangia koreensis TaxID=752657 RepID=A0ABV8X0U8_9LACT
MLDNNYEIKLDNSKSKLSTLKINEYYVHSKYDPLKESKQFVEKHYRPGFIHILFGYGLGYIAKEFNRKFVNNEFLIVIEPIQQLTVNKEDYTFLVQNTNAEIKTILSSIIPNHANVTFICSPNYDKLFPEYYLEVLDNINNRLQMNKINENTLRRFSSEWQRNFIYNLKNIPYDGDLENVFQKYDLPIILASGGPSLTKQIDLLKEYRNHCILIAAGSTVNTLVQFGLEPDFVVSIDGGENNLKHFERKKFTKSKLVYSLLNHYKIRDCFEDGYHFITSDASGVEGYYKNLSGKKLISLRGGSSVASYALSFARYISKGPIALIGQDLAYTDNKTHAEFNNNYKEVDDKYIEKRQMFYTEGYFGDKVLTDHAFYSMKETLEVLIGELKNKDRIFNCTEGGALIQGFQNIPFKQFCGNYINKSFYNRELILSVSRRAFHNNLIENLNNDLSNYKKMRKLILDNLMLLEKTKGKWIFSSTILMKMDENEQNFRKILDKTSISISIELVTFDILKYYLPKKDETKNEAYRRIYTQNYEMFNDFLKVIKEAYIYTQNIIDELMEKIQK